MNRLIGLGLALAVGVTGRDAGRTSAGTAFVFAGILRLVAAPLSYLARRC